MNRKLVITTAVLLVACFLFYLLMVWSGNIARLNELTGGNSDIVKMPEPLFRKDGSLTFFNANHSIATIQIEIAKDEISLAKGLMFRKQMSDGCGMLLIYNTGTDGKTAGSSEIKLWMKNTNIPLDMIFLDSTKTIVSISKYCKPYSDDLISSGKPAQYAVEVIAGFCDEHKINEGNSMTFLEDNK